MNKGKSARGITLVALIITIIVLLILAVVAIRAINDGGIIEKVESARDAHTEGEEKEKVNLATNGAFLEGLGKITEDNLRIQLNSYFGEGKWTLVEGTEEYLKIKINASNREYVIYTNGNVEATGVAPLVSFDKAEITANMENETSTTLTVSSNIEEDGTTQWVWTSSNESVATISGEDDKTKTINFVGGGTATITATYGENSVTCTVTVEGPITVAEADSIFTFGSFNNTLKTASLTGLKEEHKTSEEGKNIVIPDYVVNTSDGITYRINSIFLGAFKDNTNIQKVDISNNIEKIFMNAFYGCSSLTGSLTIPNSVTTIGNNAFSGCSSLTGSLTIPNSVTKIESGAFEGCTGFTGTLTISDSITSIEDRTFRNCSGLTGTLTIPDGVTTIGNNAFYGCSSLTGTLTIPDSVITIKGSAFNSCSGLTGSLTIPNSVISIEFMAFFGCSGLTGTLTIPDGVKTIENYVFSGCSGLTGTLTIPDGVTSIGEYAFEKCTGIDEIIIPNIDITIAKNAVINGCKKLTIMKSVEEIKNMTNYPWQVASKIYDKDGKSLF